MASVTITPPHVAIDANFWYCKLYSYSSGCQNILQAFLSIFDSYCHSIPTQPFLQPRLPCATEPIIAATEENSHMN